MFKGTVLCVPRSEAVRYAARYLSDLGISVIDKCAPDVTHLLLPVPSFSRGDEYLAHLLTTLPDDLIISGGNLSSALLEGYCCVDFLRDPYYLAENAAITAECAVKILTQQLEVDLSGKSVLIIGWGRIGKCLSHMLKHHDAAVCVAARKEHDLAMLRALGFDSIPICQTAAETERFDVIINSVPVLLFPQIRTQEGCVKMELASTPGMTGFDISDGRGLPGKIEPVKSGTLIAKTFLRLSL